MSKTFRVTKANGMEVEVVADTYRIVEGGALVFKNAAVDLPVRCFSGIGYLEVQPVEAKRD